MNLPPKKVEDLKESYQAGKKFSILAKEKLMWKGRKSREYNSRKGYKLFKSLSMTTKDSLPTTLS